LFKTEHNRKILSAVLYSGMEIFVFGCVHPCWEASFSSSYRGWSL